MAFESKLLAVPAQTFTGNGTSDGQITIADPYLFKIGQIVVIGSPNIELQIKRIADGAIHVGPFDDNPETRSDVSAYTVGSYIFANEQLRPWIPRDGVIPNFPKLDYTYEEAPTVAQRNLLVDKSGTPVDIIEVSGIRRLAVETSVSVSTTSSGVQDVNVVNTPTVTVGSVSGVVTTSGIAEQPVRVTNSPPVNIPTPLDVEVINSLPQHNVTVSGIVNISGVVDFQRPVHVIVDSAPASVTTISGIITVSGVAEQPVRVDQVVRVSGIVDIQRPLDVNVQNIPTVSVVEPVDVNVTNSLPQHNVTVSGVVNISGVVDFQRPVTTSGIGGEFIQGIADFTKFPLMGSHHTITISYTAPDLIEYVGWAEPQPGLSEASPVWRIGRITYSGTSILRFQWAGGNRLFNKVWDDRVTYLYG